MTAATGQLDLELINNEKIIAGRVLEVDEAYRLIAPGVPSGQAVDLSSFEQELRRRFVNLHKPMALGFFEFFDDATDALVIQPRLAFTQIEFAQRCSQAAFQQRLPEVFAFGKLGYGGVAFNPLPAHQLKLFAERALDQIIFPLNVLPPVAHALTPMDSGTRTRPVRRSFISPDFRWRSFARFLSSLRKASPCRSYTLLISCCSSGFDGTGTSNGRRSCRF